MFVIVYLVRSRSSDDNTKLNPQQGLPSRPSRIVKRKSLLTEEIPGRESRWGNNCDITGEKKKANHANCECALRGDHRCLGFDKTSELGCQQAIKSKQIHASMEVLSEASTVGGWQGRG